MHSLNARKPTNHGGILASLFDAGGEKSFVHYDSAMSPSVEKQQASDLRLGDGILQVLREYKRHGSKARQSCVYLHRSDSIEQAYHIVA